MSKVLNTTLMAIMFVAAISLSVFAFGVMYWAAGMYFGWTLTISVTAMYLLTQFVVLRAMAHWS